MQQKSKTLPIILIILLIVVLCCIVIGVALLIGGEWLKDQFVSKGTVYTDMTEVPQGPTPETIINEPVPSEAIETLDTLDQTVVPINDPVELAERLGGKQDVPDTLIDPDAPYDVGAQKTFWVSNVDTNENFQIDAVLQYVGDNSYFWIEEGVEYDPSDLVTLADTFDQEIVPIDREFFGSEWNPGVDGDPHIYVLYASNLGDSLAGYFSSADELNPLAHEYSNAHEMFLINADNVPLWDSYIYGVLAHEFQHMIHWYTDRNEATWMNEGFSMLAELLNGYDIGGHDYSYLNNTDLQLTDWGDNVGTNSPNYGASFLFMAYFLDRFGEEATQAVVAAPDNSMESITRVLDELGIRDPLTGDAITADDVLADWAVTNILLDPNVGDGRYDYSNYNPIAANVTETHSGVPAAPIQRYVHQYGVDSLLFTDLSGDLTLNFTGSTTVSLLPQSAYSGSYAFYSNKGDESDMTLTQTFDFTDEMIPIEMTYQTWYDLETDYDYLYLEASTDGGETWQILNTPSCTNYDPSGNSYGCGYNGETGGWISETVDLSQFAGQEVTLRFEYITDAAVNGEGLLLDDISIPTIGYTTDFETDDGGWDAKGFARVNNLLPQTFKVSVIQIGKETTVTNLAISDLRTASLDLMLENNDQVIVVVSGTTPFTNQEASYKIDLE